MPNYAIPPKRWYTPLMGYLLRFAAGGYLPLSWFVPPQTFPKSVEGKTGELHIEIVSHVWNYAYFLVHQLSSLVNSPPTAGQVTMTVFYSSEDRSTQALLAYFSGISVPNVTWNWQERPKQALFSRAIGRNEAALASTADWVWFCDCDILFTNGCIDSLVEQLQGQREAIVYPLSERCTPMLPSDDPLFDFDPDSVAVKQTDLARFSDVPPKRSRAAGGFQITHGAYVRALGYCNALKYYQRPTSVWQKAYEDRAFRWILGTPGKAIDFKGVCRIRHIAKGRYTGSTANTKIRSFIRRKKALFEKA